MHLALLLAPESEQLIRAIAPKAEDLHLTVIHSKQNPPISTSVQTLGDLPLPGHHLPIVGIGHKLNVFGPPKKRVHVLELVSDPFWETRRRAEQILSRRYIAWSKEWGFAPHVTLGQLTPEEVRAVQFPIQLTFDRLAWR